MTTAPAPQPTAQDALPPTQTRVIAGARHLTAAVGHWAGGHTIGAEELTRRIVKARSGAHTAAVAEHSRLAQAAHNRADKLDRKARANNGLVAADQTALATARQEGARHDAALQALGQFEVPDLDPGQVGHRRHRIAAVRYVMLTAPVGGMLAASWYWSGTVFLVTVVGGVAAALVRGDRPFELTVRPVPADLLAATPHVAFETDHQEQPGVEAAPVDTGAWREALRTHVEYAVAAAHLQQQSGVHTADLLHGLQAAGEFLGLTSATFPAKLRDAGIPTRVVKVKGAGGLGVRYDDLTTALGHSPRLHPSMVPDLTSDEELYAGEETPLGSPSPAQKRTG